MFFDDHEVLNKASALKWNKNGASNENETESIWPTVNNINVRK